MDDTKNTVEKIDTPEQTPKVITPITSGTPEKSVQQSLELSRPEWISLGVAVIIPSIAAYLASAMNPAGALSLDNDPWSIPFLVILSPPAMFSAYWQVLIPVLLPVAFCIYKAKKKLLFISWYIFAIVYAGAVYHIITIA